MFCPRCRAEYREGFSQCSDCHVALVAALPAEPPADPPPDPLSDPEPDPGRCSPDAELVSVFASANPIVLAMAKGALEDARIPFMIAGEGLGRTGSIDLLRGAVCEFVVARDREPDARSVLEPLTQPAAEEPD